MAATHLAFDDTDSPEGMCTTYLAALMLEALREYDLIGLPRLVRLNPNVPWKTRGNAAICLSLGTGRGEPGICGEVQGGPVRFYRTGSPAAPGKIMSIAEEVLEGAAQFDCDKTNPGIVCSDNRPSQSLYWRAVRAVLDIDEVESQLGACGAEWKKYKNGRGIIGAAASMSWRPQDRTWEVIAYRAPANIGSRRLIDPESVMAMDRHTAHTFNNFDYENGHVAIAPGSPCPVLFGIRGDSAGELLEARSMIRSEPYPCWLLFLTNQGTDDHVVTRPISKLSAGLSVRVRARVASAPRTIEGGHVVLRISDGNEMDAVFYEPSGPLRDAARMLLPGDMVIIYGSVRNEPRGINVEKMQVLALAEHRTKCANPRCAECDKRMGSMGAGQGYRCKVCGARAPASAAETTPIPRGIAPGWYEPPVSSRRHLYMPVRRMSRGEINNLL